MLTFAQSLRGFATAAALIGAASVAQAGETLDAIKARGAVACAVNTGLPGWSSPDSQGAGRASTWISAAPSRSRCSMTRTR